MNEEELRQHRIQQLRNMAATDTTGFAAIALSVVDDLLKENTKLSTKVEKMKKNKAWIVTKDLIQEIKSEHTSFILSLVQEACQTMQIGRASTEYNKGYKEALTSIETYCEQLKTGGNQ